MQQTKTLYLRLVQATDVDFILSLRLNSNLNKYLCKVSNDRDEQLKWLDLYKKRELLGIDYYFVIVDKKLGDIGLIRIYDINYLSSSFTWGSWITCENRPKYAALESLLLAYDFAFNELGLNLAKFQVMKDNHHAIAFYERFGNLKKSADATNLYFELSKTLYISLKYNRYHSIFLNP